MSAFAKFMTMTSKSPFSIGVDHCVGYCRRAHFRLQIVSRHFRRWHQVALFARERFFDAAIEEISDVGVLFGFGHAQILAVQLRKDIRQDVLEFFRRQNVAQPRPGFFVLRHARRMQIFRAARDRGILSKPGSTKARVISRPRSARKLKKITASSSRIRPRGTAGLPGAARVVIDAGSMNSSVTPFS